MAPATRPRAAVASASATPLIYGEPQDDPRVAGWLVPEDNCTQLGYEIILRAYCDIGICEQPEGSNRGTRIDAMAKRWGSPLGSYWCALWLMGVWADRGALVPREGARVENWRSLVIPEWRMTFSNMIRASAEVQKHLIGAAVLYESAAQKRLVHIGLIARITGNRVFTIEGNRGFAGGLTNNGEWCTLEPSERHDVYGVVLPTMSKTYAAKRQIIRQKLDP